MNKVRRLKSEINILEDEIQYLENRVEQIDFEEGELEAERFDILYDIPKYQDELVKLKKKLKIAKHNSEPLDGQVAFVKTGYDQIVVIDSPELLK